MHYIFKNIHTKKMYRMTQITCHNNILTYTLKNLNNLEFFNILTYFQGEF